MRTTSKVAMVTGAGSGIGRQATLALLASGYSVMLAGRHIETLEQTVTDARDQGSRGLPVVADVSNPESVQALFTKTRETFGRLDVLFNNAGINVAATPLEDLTYDQWQSVVNINLSGSFLCAQAAYKMMKEQHPQGGRIINNGSISAHVPRPHAIAYNATKHAITGLTRSISLEGRKYNIACGQIDIGNAATEMTRKMKTGVLQANGTLAVEPTMDVEQVARTVVFMANLPLDANIQFMTVMATKMPYIGRG